MMGLEPTTFCMAKAGGRARPFACSDCMRDCDRFVLSRPAICGLRGCAASRSCRRRSADAGARVLPMARKPDAELVAKELLQEVDADVAELGDARFPLRVEAADVAHGSVAAERDAERRDELAEQRQHAVGTVGMVMRV